VLVAIANTRLNLLTGNVSSGSDEVIAAELGKVQREDQVSLKELWYVTLAVDRPITLADANFTDNRYVWAATSTELRRGKMRCAAMQRERSTWQSQQCRRFSYPRAWFQRESSAEATSSPTVVSLRPILGSREARPALEFTTPTPSRSRVSALG
jgi:hypothetical protein